MSKELIISSGREEVVIALLENGKLSELHRETLDKKISVGDLYLGTVKKIVQGLNAAFVNIGASKDAFLHYQDLGPQVKSFIKFLSKAQDKSVATPSLSRFALEGSISKDGSIAEVLQVGQRILVQVTKEPISSKGPRLTSEVSIAGRYLVIMPFSEKVSVSQKIKDSVERHRLIETIEKINPKGFGVIIRTVAQDKKVEALQADLLYLMNKWKKAANNFAKKSPPVKILSERDKASCILRDTFNDDFTSIVCDDKDLHEDIHSYLSIIAPEKTGIVEHYRGDMPIFEKFGVERQIKISLGRNVPFSKGAYLVIEHTEALHVIDVNSGMGKHIKGNKNDTALEVNLLAATEMARQLRLRDMGGIIVVDFIDMAQSGERKQLYEHLRNEMERDKAKHKILPPSKFGLVQITRQRVRPQLSFITNEPNPNNSKEIISPLAHVRHIESILETVAQGQKKISLHTHPFISAYLKQGWISIRLRWFLRYKKWIHVVPRDSFRYLEYRFLDGKNKVLSSYRN
ncbi:MAG: Rne/Rng family ribonuclease [Flavobacteriales bacterium Tduv]